MKKDQHYTIYKLLAGVALSFLLWGTSCTPRKEEPQLKDVTYVEASLLSSSINQDNLLFEDKVDNVTMLVFPSAKAERSAYVRVEASKGDVTKIPATKVAQGVNDIYFVANVSESELSGLLTRGQIEDFLTKKITFTATSSLGLLPMARVYRNQIIGPGTEENPFPFKPIIEGSTPFAPVSNFEVAKLKVTDVRGKVGLVRSCAKISVTLSGEGVKDVSSVECYNVAEQFSFAQLPATSSYELKSSPVRFDFTPMPLTPQSRKGHIYAPERLFHSSMPSWSEADSKQKITYIKLQTKGGRELLIPIAHNASESIETGGTYLDFVTGAKLGKDGAKPDYNIIRNMHYSLNINVSADAGKIDVSLQVMPWSLISSEFSYARPKYSITVSTPKESNVLNSRIGDDLLLHNGDAATITFSIEEPKGAVWVASLTNALHYDLTGTRSGIVDKISQTYTMTIKPKGRFDNTPRYTQFFITVNGQEIFLGDLNTVADADSKGRFINEVPGAKRWQFKQVE